MPITWVTSFTEPIYRSIGQRLLASFLAYRVPGVLRVYPEGMLPTQSAIPGRLGWSEDLAAHPLLAEFLVSNAPYIPADLGGSWAGPCLCPRPSDPHDRRHKPGCPGAWFNRHASRWYRKVLALKLAADSSPLAPIVWIDSDVVFHKAPTVEAMESWFGGQSLFYLKGPRRERETGVAGYRGEAGARFIEAMHGRYSSGAYLTDGRWDDAYQHRMTHKTLPDVSGADLARGMSGHSDVVPHSPLAEFMAHFKGHNSRVTGLFK